ncbi:hypothetical protein [Nocardiopsis halophila]|uniref:hypothetical protein n=1 Tax=Nocardiopsis halophila TaxID=141692 RepID=UPI000346239C|nr:hypothetical protein [Nocardiopsis halophila]
MSLRETVFTPHFLAQAEALPERSRVRAFAYVLELADEPDPSRIAQADPEIPHVWIMYRFDVTISAAVYEAVLRVDALTVRANG